MSDQEFIPSAPEESDFQDTEIFKKWSNVGGVRRFCSIRTFLGAGKLGVDVGQATDSGVAATLCWTDAVDLSAFLKAIVSGGSIVYPDNEFMSFGGTYVDGKPVSRLLKIAPWMKGEERASDGSMMVKTGHFEATVGSAGAFVPNYNNLISQHMVKITPTEFQRMQYMVELAILRHTIAAGDNAFVQLNGQNR